MHFEILVEDASGKIALDEIVKKILGSHGDSHTWRIIAYKGIGRIPKNLRGKSDPRKRILLEVLQKCNPSPLTKFRFAIEEIEAWYFGDRKAILTAYPGANTRILDSYHQDSICGTWEKLADAIYPGGSRALQKAGWPHPGEEKCNWARRIAGHIDIEKNKSKSFQAFRNCLLILANN
jgi:hypothetical protein